MNEIKKCDYGCGQEAKYQMKNGKWCCSKFVSSCRVIRNKNSLVKKGKKPNWKNGHGKPMLNVAPWNKGLTKDKDKRIERCVLERKKNFKNGKIKVYGYCLDEEDEKLRRLKISKTASINKKSGGKRHGSGRGKKGWYKGYWCDSSWELAWVVYQLEHNISFKRNQQGFEYEFERIVHKYYPDFKMEDGSYVEVKGWLDEQNKVKIAQFKGSLTVIGKKEIKPYLYYVISKYGKDFIKLYKMEA